MTAAAMSLTSRSAQAVAARGLDLRLLGLDTDTSTSAGMLAFNVATLAQFERRGIGEHTREVSDIADKRAERLQLGRPGKLSPKVVTRINPADLRSFTRS